jgi:hypothetical protein
LDSAQLFVNEQPIGSQIGVYEFHRDDEAPAMVTNLTANKTAVNGAIAGIWTNYVQYFSSGSRCWDALAAAVKSLGASNNDEAHYVVFVSDGQDQSSTATLKSVVTTASNNAVRIFAVGFGNDINVGNLQELATNTYGAYYTGSTLADMATEFGEVTAALNGQYILRWATLKRTAATFMPSFTVSYQGLTADSPTNPVSVTNFDTYTTNVDSTTTPPTTNISTNNVTNYITNFIIAPYTPTKYAGPVTVGALRLVPNAAVQPTGASLRATYVPRYIRQLLIRYRANWPCTTVPYTNTGQLLYNWSAVATNDNSNNTWLLLSSPDPQDISSSLEFGTFGNLVDFDFYDSIGTNSAFALLNADTNIYFTNKIAGGQIFVISNGAAWTTNLPALPKGTPVPWLIANGFLNNWTNAELSDPDNTGMPLWEDYRANLNPNNPNSLFVIRSVAKGSDGRNQITFSSAVNRSYTLESSSDLTSWTTIEEGILGTGTNITVTDTRYLVSPQIYYRVQVNF